MKKQVATFMIGCLLAGAASADTLFTGAVDSDFLTADNWDNGVPVSGIATINGGLTAESGASYDFLAATLKVGIGGTAGTLNVNSGTLESSNGSGGVDVGDGVGSVGTINIASGAKLIVTGASSDLLIGLNGGYGTVTVAGTLDTIKALEILNGQLVFESGAVGVPGFKDEFVVDNAGVLVFKTDGSTIATVHANTGSFARILELGSTSTLDMQLGGTHSIGDSWIVIDNILAFNGVAGGDGDGTFGNVINSLNPSDEFSVDYSGGSVVVTLIPEPATLGLIAAFGGGVLFIRRRLMM